MLRLPKILSDEYRAATDREIRSWSFGRVTASRRLSWEPQGTLDDERIFGPTRDYECACGKYRGEKYSRMICDICGVKVTTAAVRRERFGHIELAAPVPHPFGADGERLSVVPVLPAGFLGSSAGRPLADMYEELLEAGVTTEVQRATATIERVFVLVLPAAGLAAEWELPERVAFARGLALERRLGAEA